MLVKNPDERPTVTEIKEHAWFKQFQIVKLQAAPKLVDIAKIEAETPQGYQVIGKTEQSAEKQSIRTSSVSQVSGDAKMDGSQTSKLGEEDMQYSESSSESETKSDIFEELTIKENLEKLRTMVSSHNEEQYTYKTNLSVKELEINSRLAKVKDLQTAIEEKHVYKSYIQKNIEKHTVQLAEKSAEIDKLQLISTPEKLESLATAVRNEFVEKTAMFNLESKSLSQLRLQYEQLSAEVSQKEKLMNDLSNKQQKLHQDFKISRVSLASGLSDVKLNHALMQSRLNKGPRKSMLEPDDQQRANELIELIRTRVAEIENESQGITYLKKLIDAQENAIFSREEDINSLTATYDRKKLDLRQDLQVKMREIKQIQREQQTKAEQKAREKHEQKRKDLTDALMKARSNDFRSFFSSEDCTRMKEMHLVRATQEMQTRQQSLQQNIDLLLRVRTELSAKLSQLHSQEIELKAFRRK